MRRDKEGPGRLKELVDLALSFAGLRGRPAVIWWLVTDNVPNQEEIFLKEITEQVNQTLGIERNCLFEVKTTHRSRKLFRVRISPKLC